MPIVDLPADQGIPLEEQMRVEHEQAKDRAIAELMRGRFGASVGIAPFSLRLKRSLEEGVLLFAKHALIVALWLGTGFLLWREIAIVKAQAANGQGAYQFLVANQKELNGLIESRKLINAAVDKADKGEKK